MQLSVSLHFILRFSEQVVFLKCNLYVSQRLSFSNCSVTREEIKVPAFFLLLYEMFPCRTFSYLVSPFFCKVKLNYYLYREIFVLAPQPS